MASVTPFQVSVRADGEGTTVAARGELDLAAAPQLRLALIETLEGGARRLDVDLHDVTFIDSTGISVILQAWQRLDAEGGRLAVVAASPVVARVLSAAGLDRLLGLDA
jgi:anti-sigma B factor antagonist